MDRKDKVNLLLTREWSAAYEEAEDNVEESSRATFLYKAEARLNWAHSCNTEADGSVADSSNMEADGLVPDEDSSGFGVLACR
jgi:hypothetical protein